VGTTKVFTVVGQVEGSSDVRVLGHSTVANDGLRKGNVEDIAATSEAIRESVAAVERQTGHRIKSAYVGVTGAHVTFENAHQTFEGIGSSGVVTAEDLRRMSQRIAADSAGSVTEPGRKIIHAIPMEYAVDGQEGIRNPVGMHSRQIEVEAHLVSGGSYYIDKLIKAVEGAEVRVDGLVLEPLASALSVLTPEEREHGAVIVDIGGGTTDIVGFKHSHICYTGVIPVAGSQFTNDLVQAYHTSQEAAEEIKVKYASAEPISVDMKDIVVLPVPGQDVEQRIQRREVCQLVKERAQELVAMVKSKVNEADMEDCAIVLTGGGAKLPGLQHMVERTFRSHVRTGAPNGHSHVPPELMNPAYATGVGIMMWAAAEGGSAAASRKPLSLESSLTGLIAMWSKQMKRWAPWAVLAPKHQ
jgi:cell division protein FtsA